MNLAETPPDRAEVPETAPAGKWRQFLYLQNIIGNYDKYKNNSAKNGD